jgi:SAM-dependent methyltransferase
MSGATRTRDRAARERAYWDDAYRPGGPFHARCLWTKRVEGISYIGERFYRLAGELRYKRALSLGGGVDRLGIFLAKAGNRVVTVDVSPVAAAATAALAAREGVADRLSPVVGEAEDALFAKESFDAVLCKRSLHHLAVPRAVARAHELLVPGGVLLAEEPICLPRWLLWAHEKFPFAPGAVRTPDERELVPEDFSLLRRTFRKVRVCYFDLLARESVAYFLCKARAEWLLRPLGKFDYFLVNRCLPVLRYLCTYAIIEAVK